MSNRKNIWLEGMMGLIIGDALGMPVQFISRKEVQRNPITGMEGFGTYNKPAGTWSDDGSMAIATLDSMRRKKCIDYDDIMCSFLAWDREGKYTQHGEAFDQGFTCMTAIDNYERKRNYKTCGRTGEWANGNGALMRIMPVCLYAYIQHKNDNVSLEEAIAYVHQATALTHNHLRAKMASGIYFFMIQSILDNEGDLNQKLQKGIDNAKHFYKSDSTNLDEWKKFERMSDVVKFAATDEDEIKSSGYVIDSIEAAVWSLITTNTLEAGLLKAVNLGDDTDTVGAIAGGLAVLHYGYQSIPETWRNAIIKGEEVVSLCEQVDRILLRSKSI